MSELFTNYEQRINTKDEIQENKKRRETNFAPRLSHFVFNIITY